MAGKLSNEALNRIFNAYDIVGDVAIIRTTPATEKYSTTIAKAIMQTHKNVKTVLLQASPVHGDFRTRKLKLVMGENKAITMHVENGCKFVVDLENTYFSPRLSYERMRVASQVKPKEVVVNMFAGVGCFSLIIARHSSASKIYSIDINPKAVQLMRENIRINGFFGRVVPLQGDAKEIIENKLKNNADRVIMPLPEKALQYLSFAILALKKRKGWIHYYDFEHATREENPIQKVTRRVTEKLERLNMSFKISNGRIIRSTGPNWYQIVLDIQTI
ncbi:MAG: class I SAM-dependent methyltransferase family protein [Candidatus Bathyarchaeia archaeon]